MSHKVAPEVEVPENTVDYTRANVSGRELQVSSLMKNPKVADSKTAAVLVSRIKKVTNQQRLNDVLNAAAALASIMVVYYEVTFMQSEEFYERFTETRDGEEVVTKNHNESNVKVNVMRAANICLTALILLFVHRHWMIELVLKKLKGELPSVCKF